MLGIDAQYYSHIYIGVISILSIIVFQHYSTYPQSRILEQRGRKSLGTLLLMAVVSVFIGLRPVSGLYFVDMSGYSAYYSIYEGEPFFFNWTADNLLFDNSLLFLASKGIPQEFFFLSNAIIYFGGMAWACSILFPRDKMAAFLVCLGAFSTFSYATNGIKAGSAASLFLIALAMYKNRKLLWAIIFILLSIGFHHSMVVPAAAFLTCLFITDSKVFFLIWGIAFIIALLHITFFQNLLAGLADEQGAEYLTSDDGYIRRDILGGFRIDFILYSVVPIVVGWIGLRKKHIISRNYSFLLNIYLLSNAIWLLCMYAEFTNRIAYLSWFMLPIVLIYPLLNEKWGNKQYQTFQWVALGHLGFTLFMQYIFY